MVIGSGHIYRNAPHSIDSIRDHTVAHVDHHSRLVLGQIIIRKPTKPFDVTRLLTVLGQFGKTILFVKPLDTGAFAPVRYQANPHRVNMIDPLVLVDRFKQDYIAKAGLHRKPTRRMAT